MASRLARMRAASISSPSASRLPSRRAPAARPTGEAWVLKQALEKLRVPVDWFSDPERVHREALGLRWLQELAPPGSITQLVFEDHEHHLLAMEAVPEPHENWKTMLLEGRVRDEHVEQFGRLLGEVHRNAHERREELAPIFEDRSFFESLRLEPYYGYTATQVPAAADFLHALVQDTRACRISLTHGDYSPKNILIHEGRLVLLDHEVIHFGDPAFDLGFSLTHFLSKAHHLPDQRAAFAQERGLHVGHLDSLLGRVAGRSPLEYLDEEERLRQKEAVLALMRRTPKTVPELVEGFIARL